VKAHKVEIHPEARIDFYAQLEYVESKVKIVHITGWPGLPVVRVA
jgi:hypothetical protein